MIESKDIFRQYSISLVAGRLYLDYRVSINNSQGIEPEMFAESWLNHFVEGADKEFTNNVCEVFLNRLLMESREDV